MRKATLIVVAALCLIGASTAQAASDPRVPALQRKVNTLTFQVGQMTAAIRHDELNTVCDNTYQTIIDIGFYNVIFAYILGGAPYSGTVPNDGGACVAVGRTPPAPPRFLSAKPGPFESMVGLLAAAAR